MIKVNVDLGENSYPIYIGEHLLAQANLSLPIVGNEVLIVTNPTVAAHYLQPLTQYLSAYRVHELIIPDGEQFKTLETVNLIFDALLRHKFSRKVTLLALGGGVIGDMTGFAAACYQRGVGFIQVPTTLLAQVDSAVGGKTAVNHRLGKNMIGAFHQPLAVLSDVSSLNTLPHREYAAGLAEVIKYGLIWDAEFFVYLMQNQTALLNKQADVLIHTIARCCEIKAQIVSQDPTEQGLRAILNFGHTFAHAIEKIMGYGELLHGEAVAIGMLLAVKLSIVLGNTDNSLYGRLESWLLTMQLPTKLPKACSIDSMLEAMAYDKKKTGSSLRFIILKALGKAEITDAVNELQLREVLESSYE